MNPADQLIVALDDPDVQRSIGIHKALRSTTRNFKIGASSLVQAYSYYLLESIGNYGNLMLDLKLYDTRDTVKRTMEIVARIGARWVTVHADCAEHAIGFGPKVLIVRRLTDGALASQTQASEFTLFDDSVCDGFVCSVATATRIRSHTSKPIVCPGIRPAGSEANNHVLPSTPSDAIRNGADYLIVGRPIYTHPDPAAAAGAIIREIEEAIPGSQP